MIDDDQVMLVEWKAENSSDEAVWAVLQVMQAVAVRTKERSRLRSLFFALRLKSQDTAEISETAAGRRYVRSGRNPRTR